MSPPNVRHSCASVEAYTPEPIAAAARVVLNGIELDPFSCALANQNVKAVRFFTREDDGFAQPWMARTVLSNPPGGKDGNESRQKAAWQKLAKAWQACEVGAAIAVLFSLELLQVSQSGWDGLLPLDFPHCVPRSRIAYNRVTEAVAVRQASLFEQAVDAIPDGVEEADAPPHASAIVYLPAPNQAIRPADVLLHRACAGVGQFAGAHDRAGLARFKKAFAPLGRCVWTREGW